MLASQLSAAVVQELRDETRGAIWTKHARGRQQEHGVSDAAAIACLRLGEIATYDKFYNSRRVKLVRGRTVMVIDLTYKEIVTVWERAET